MGRSWEAGGSRRTQRLTPFAEVGKWNEYREASHKRKNNEVGNVCLGNVEACMALLVYGGSVEFVHIWFQGLSL